nr:putative ribonuclease H-like domain-containing protein [Tanacetum cinerariifolium]
MLADSKLPTMFWTEAVSTACYVLNRVSITNPHNKTPYELLSGKVPNISHLKPFGCQVTILNTSDHLGKFERKAYEGFLVRYAANSKAYRVYNLSSKKIKETLNLRYLEDKPNVHGLGQEWYFDIDYLTDSLGYTRFKTNTPAGIQDTNINAGTQDDDSESKWDEQAILVPSFPSNSFSAEKYGFKFSNEIAEMLHQAKIETRRNLVLAAEDPAGSIVFTGGVPAGSIPTRSVPAGNVPTGGVLAGSVDSPGFSNPATSESVPVVFNPDHADNSTLPLGYSLGSSKHSTRFPSPSDLENHQPNACIFSSSSYDDDFCADVTNLASSVVVDPVATQREMQQFFNQQVWKLVPLPDGKIAIGTKWILKNKRNSRVARIEAIRLFLAFASYMGFMVYQKDVKSAFLYGEIEEEVYVTQPKGFEDPHIPKHVYRVVKALYGLHQAPRACQDKYVKDMLKKFDMESVRTVTTPYEVLKPKSKNEPDDAINVHLYRSMIGSLMYLIASRPDISDSDYAGSYCDRKSTTGGCQFLGRRLISWLCKKQTIGATSSTEAEYVAAASCCGQVFLLVVLVHANVLVPAGSCTIPTGSYTIPTGSYSLMLLDWFLLDDHNKVAYLAKGKGWEAYEQILDFLNRSHIRYALTHHPPIVFDSLVKQFWATATVRTLEAWPSEIIATIDGNEVVVTESLIRTQLQLHDETGP